MIGGSLLPEMYTPFAKYFVKYIQAYQTAGISGALYLAPKRAIVCARQLSRHVDECRDADDDFARFYPAGARGQYNLTNTTVLVYDHNWDRNDYPRPFFRIATLLASPQVAGIAWHGYGGAHRA